MTIDSKALRMAMRQWVTGVTIVTTAHGEERAGMTVSSFTSVSLEPPTVLVCLNKTTYTHTLVLQSGVFAVSLLGTGQGGLSNRFAGLEPGVTDRFEGLEVMIAETGSPLLPGAVAWLDCVVRARHDTTTHTIFIGEVVYAMSEADRDPLVYYNRSYQLLVPVESTQEKAKS